MTHEELIQRLCDDGEESIRQSYPDPTDPQRRGAMLGFKIVRSIKDPAEFPATLQSRTAVEADMKASNEDPDKYWAYRWATLQVEFVWEILKESLKILPSTAAEALHQAGIANVRKGAESRVDAGFSNPDELQSRRNISEQAMREAK
jgi:hypothetical protein